MFDLIPDFPGASRNRPGRKEEEKAMETDFVKSIMFEENQHVGEPSGSITFYNWQGEPLVSFFGKTEESLRKN